MEETLFSSRIKRPLADRLRPQSLSEVVGQDHVVGDNAERHVLEEFAEELFANPCLEL